MLEVLATSFGSSRMLECGIPLIVERNFGGGTPVDLIRKDLGLISDGSEDMVEIVITMEETAGIEVRRNV